MAYLVKQSDRAAPVTSPVPVDESLPRACVIGAGSSGITSAKHLYLAGIPFDCYESGSDIGGTWVYDNSNGRSACYDSLEINTSCPRMAYSDFPMPADYPPYARHDQVAAYFQQYVDHFGFRHTITFDTTVEDVTRTADGRWDVRVSGPDGTATRTYDAVLVANGHHWDPRWPEPAYPGTFDGEQVHAHDYRSREQLAGRDVVVVGAGNSAMDIAVEASYAARTTTWSVRRTEWVLRKFFLGKPSDQGLLPPSWVPWWVTGLRLRIGALTAGSMTKYGLPAPAHKPGQSHPVQSEKIRERLAAGAVAARPGIERLDGDRVVFVDGTTAPADLIVWATGYQVSFPFLAPDLVSARDNDLPLWKRTVHPDLPGLYFLGLLQPFGAVMPLAEAQASWIAETLAGRYVPPADDVVRRQMEAEHRRDTKRFYDSPRHTMEVDFDHYLWDLGRELEAGRGRAAARTSSVHSSAPVPAPTRGGGVRRAVAGLALGAVRWKAVGDVPQRGVLVGAPHTSNWDWVLTILLAWRYGITIRLLVKKELFVGPLGWLLRRTGAVELDRKNPASTIKELLAEAEGGDPWLLGIAAEGTRSRGDYWKSGFYRIARQTGLPITLAFIDVPSRSVGWGPTFHPTGDVGADMDLVREFYADKTGINPEGFTPPRLREEG
ncbi:hypothetical protein GCM10023339_44260 [Alloalcanivorax gelatiniphagus]